MLSIRAMEKAMEKAKALAGGAAAMANAIGGLTSQAVSQWKRAPAERVLDIERLTGVSRHELRPDVFGPPPDSDDAGDASVEACPGGDTSSRPLPGQAVFDERAA
jgi:DNA-binding transcriptional regulator YdaS (Cro superfamily)